MLSFTQSLNGQKPFYSFSTSANKQAKHSIIFTKITMTKLRILPSNVKKTLSSESLLGSLCRDISRLMMVFSFVSRGLGVLLDQSVNNRFAKCAALASAVVSRHTPLLSEAASIIDAWA